MRAVRCHAGLVRVLDVPEPSGEGVRVRVRSAGICGSDLHLVESAFAPPGTLGHEIAGLLDDGTPVAIEPLAPCRTCDRCQEGAYNLCRQGPAIVIGVGRDGGMADEIRVPSEAIVKLSDAVKIESACLVEPLAVAVHGLRKAGVCTGDSVLVIGGGTIGLCALAAARFMGATVALEARYDAQREAGDRLGAGPATEEYDVVVESAGTDSALATAVAAARPGGTLILLASYWEGTAQVPGMALCMKEIRVLPSSMYAVTEGIRDIDLAARILAERSEIPDAIISHRFPLDAAADAFATARDRSAGAIKVVLEP